MCLANVNRQYNILTRCLGVKKKDVHPQMDAD